MTAIESGLRPLLRAAPLAGAASIFTVLAFWSFLLSGAGMGMSIWSMSTLSFPVITPQPNMTMMPSGFLAYMVMWWVMMMAMMMPGTMKHLPLEAGRSRSADSRIVAFWMGYAGIWLLFSAAAAAVQLYLVSSGLLHETMMWSTSRILNACLLGLVGLYQLSPWKTRYLTACLRFSASNRAFCDGLFYGLQCLGSSAVLMLLMLVFGVMNIYWMGILAALVALEKWLKIPFVFSALIGVLCVAASLYLFVSVAF